MTLAKSQTVLFVVVFLAFAYAFVKYYWKARLTIFPHMLTQKTTPRHHHIPDHLRPSYEKNVARGIKETHSKKAVIVGMVRDVEKSVPTIIKKVENLGLHFKDYLVVIVENDSEDRTRELLFEWRKKNPRVTILGCGVNSPEKCVIPKTPKTIGHTADRPRIEKMANLRNIYLEYLKKSIDPKEYPYTIIWDLDSLSVLYEDGFLNSMGILAKDQDTGVMCANGIYQWGPFSYFYDTFAYLEKGERFDLNNHTAHNLRHGALEPIGQRGGDSKEVESCFSGFTIYRTPVLVEASYDLPKDHLVCEHVALHQRMKGVKKVVNPSLINLILLNE